MKFPSHCIIILEIKNCCLYRVSQESVNWLVKCTWKYITNFFYCMLCKGYAKIHLTLSLGPSRSITLSFITKLIYKNYSKWDTPRSVNKSQCCDKSSSNWLAGLNLNIPVNTWECLRLTDFWVTLFFSRKINVVTLLRTRRHLLNLSTAYTNT
jgi:hypothetical protein